MVISLNAGPIDKYLMRDVANGNRGRVGQNKSSSDDEDLLLLYGLPCENSPSPVQWGDN